MTRRMRTGDWEEGGQVQEKQTEKEQQKTWQEGDGDNVTVGEGVNERREGDKKKGREKEQREGGTEKSQLSSRCNTEELF